MWWKSGNHQIPICNRSDDQQEALAAAIAAMRTWAADRPPEQVTMRPGVARRIHAIVQPVLRAAAWPRWLLLERAFLDGSATGDLLFAALTLRTMCEEVLRLHALDLDANQLARLAASNNDGDGQRLQLYFAVAWTSIGPLSEQTVLEGRDWPSLKDMAKAMPYREKARASLNSYVHPNYGSHIAALFPERTSAARQRGAHHAPWPWCTPFISS
jgi:hypothetical protein